MNVNECWYKEVCQKYNTKECNDMCVRYAEMYHMMKYSGIPSNRFHSQKIFAVPTDIEAYTKLNEIKNNIKDFVQSGKNLYLYSENTGNCKSTWAIKLLQSYFNSIWAGNGLRIRGFFIPTQAYLLDRKNTQFNSSATEDNKLFSVTDEFGTNLLTMKNILNADVIVWDDFVVKTLSAYDYANLFAILDQRYLNNKSNIFTSSCSLETLDDLYGAKISSRIRMNCDVIKFSSSDFRTTMNGGNNNG